MYSDWCIGQMPHLWEMNANAKLGFSSSGDYAISNFRIKMKKVTISVYVRDMHGLYKGSHYFCVQSFDRRMKRPNTKDSVGTGHNTIYYKVCHLAFVRTVSAHMTVL